MNVHNIRKLSANIIVNVMAIMVSACTTIPSLMPTPQLYLDEPFEENQVPNELQIPGAEIFYITDRAVNQPSSNSKKSDADESEFNYGAGGLLL